MATLLQQGIARLRANQDGQVVGTAFLISARHVMTCAHVVNEAFGSSWDAAECPGASVWIEFPFAQPRGGTGLTATVVEWRPAASGPATDIAVLELEAEVAIRPYRLAAVPPDLARPFGRRASPKATTEEWMPPVNSRRQSSMAACSRAATRCLASS
jgi:hypothetical protein